LSINTSTGAGTLVGPSGLTVTLSLARDSSGTLFTATTGAIANLVTINPVTGVGSLGPAITGTGLADIGVSGLSFSSTGVLFASIRDVNLVTPPGLYTINKVTGAASFIGTISSDSVTDIAFSPTGTLYGWDNDLGGLVTINTLTGAGTLVHSGPPGGDLRALTFDSNGNLFGVGMGLYRINTTTRATTLVGNIGFPNDFPRGIAFTAAPEPGTLTLIGTAVVVAFAVRRLRDPRKA